MKTIVRKPLMIKNHEASSKKIRQLIHYFVFFLVVFEKLYKLIFIQLSEAKSLKNKALSYDQTPLVRNLDTKIEISSLNGLSPVISNILK